MPRLARAIREDAFFLTMKSDAATGIRAKTAMPDAAPKSVMPSGAPHRGDAGATGNGDSDDRRVAQKVKRAAPTRRMGFALLRLTH
jgi:hypothetical protein